MRITQSENTWSNCNAAGRGTVVTGSLRRLNSDSVLNFQHNKDICSTHNNNMIERLDAVLPFHVQYVSTKILRFKWNRPVPGWQWRDWKNP